MTVGGFPAATATASGEQWTFRLYLVRFGSEVYRIIYAAKNRTEAVDKSFRDSLGKGPVTDFPVVGTKIVLEDGSYHDVDSSEKAFYTAAQGCFREYFAKAAPVLLEPIMNIEIECPEHFQGPVVGDLISRRGLITNTDIRDGITVATAEVPLAETFGYATDIRSMTQGQGTFTMEFATYRRVPSNIQEEIIAAKKKAELVGSK